MSYRILHNKKQALACFVYANSKVLLIALFWLGLIHNNLTTADLGFIHGGNHFFGVGVVYFYEPKPSRPTGFPIAYDTARYNRSIRTEYVFKL